MTKTSTTKPASRNKVWFELDHGYVEIEWKAGEESGTVSRGVAYFSGDWEAEMDAGNVFRHPYTGQVYRFFPPTAWRDEAGLEVQIWRQIGSVRTR